MKIVIATNNQGKVKEFKQMLEPLGYEPVSLRDEGIEIEVQEDGETFAENAHIKPFCNQFTPAGRLWQGVAAKNR